MTEKIKEVAERLFYEVPYSEPSEKTKAKVISAMEREYESLRDGGCNEIQALGGVMHNYGTLEAAAELAEISDTSQLLSGENAVTKKRFRRDFGIYRLASIISSYVFSCAVTSLAYFVIYLSPFMILNLLIYAGVSVLIMLPFRKMIKRYSYSSVKLMPEARELLYLYSDRFKKRTLNSFPLFVILTANFISLTFERAKLSDMNHEELINLIVSNSLYMQIAIVICMKNLLYVFFLGRMSDADSRKQSRNYIGRSGLISAAFLAAGILITILLSSVLHDQYTVLYILAAVYTIVYLLLNYKKRAAIVIRNFRVNRMRVAAVVTAISLLAGVSSMKTDKWLLQPYIMTVREVEHTDHDISYDENSGVFTITADEGDFRILHLTDIHIGGSAFSAYKDFKALDACYRLIENTHPDFVIVTGDMVFPLGIMSLSLNNQSPVMQFASFMRNVGIPWAFTFGNHDTESMATGSREDICRLYESLSYVNSGNLLYPDVQPRITGRSNQMITIKNPDGTTRQALFLIDSNDYTGNGINDYDYIHDDQVEWYAEKVKSLDDGVKSMLFFHIPLREYSEAYKLYENGSSEVGYYFGEIGETMIDPICCSDYPSKLFDTAVELGSTQAMFCGHDHYNNISLEYKGIRLSYGMSIDYLAMPGISKDHKQRGGELITLRRDGSFDLTQIPLDEIK